MSNITVSLNFSYSGGWYDGKFQGVCTIDYPIPGRMDTITMRYEAECQSDLFVLIGADLDAYLASGGEIAKEWVKAGPDNLQKLQALELEIDTIKRKIKRDRDYADTREQSLPALEEQAAQLREKLSGG